MKGNLFLSTPITASIACRLNTAIQKVEILNINIDRDKSGSCVFTPIACDTRKIKHDKSISDQTMFAVFLTPFSKTKKPIPSMVMHETRTTTL